MIYGVHTDYTPPREFTAVMDNRCLDYQGDMEIKKGDVVLVSAVLEDGTGVANINGFNRLIDMRYYVKGRAKNFIFGGFAKKYVLYEFEGKEVDEDDEDDEGDEGDEDEGFSVDTSHIDTSQIPDEYCLNIEDLVPFKKEGWVTYKDEIDIFGEDNEK